MDQIKAYQAVAYMFEHFLNGARKRTRTSTSLRTLAPEASASTNSTIRAGYEEYRVIKDDLDFVYIKLWLVKRVVALLLLKQFIQ